MSIYEILKSKIQSVTGDTLVATSNNYNITISGDISSNFQNLNNSEIYFLILSSQIYKDLIHNNARNLLNQILSGEF